MGRSKFPGKPSKHGNRTRVNVLATNNAVNNAAAAAATASAAAGAETTAGGGAAANTNGNASAGHSERNPSVVAVDDDDEEEEALDEDDEHDAKRQRGRQQAISKSNKTNKALNASVENADNRRTLRVCRAKKPHAAKSKKKTSPIKMRTRVLVTSSPHPLTRSRATRRTSLNGSLNRSLRRERKEREVGKFVLPSRSAHSSRVIKPNKRFLSLDQDQTRVIRKRVKRQCNIGKTVTFADQVVFVDSESPTSTSEVQDEEEKTVMDVPSPASPLPSPVQGKVLLRQPRLQLHSTKLADTSSEGPFSVSTSSSPKTITCGVCGAVRFYRFAKNARKFNIFACESCRKFISKLIKRTTITNTSALSCLKGHGLCHVPPHSRSQQLKFGARCAACWLKLCLRCFQIPMALKSSLTKLLPKYMQPSETNSLPLLSWQAQSSPITSTSPVHEQQSYKPEFGQTPPSPLQLHASPSRTVDVVSTSTPVQVRQRPVRLKQQIRPVEKPSPPPVVEIKRAKVDLKGPRVKHVCRSASIVLGQLPATFPPEISSNTKVDDVKESVNKVEDKPVEVKKVKEKKEEVCKPKDIVPTSLEMEVSSVCQDTTKETKEKVGDKEKHTIQPSVVDMEAESQLISSKKEKLQKQQQPAPLSMLPMEMTNPSFNKKCKKVTQLENPNLLNIDFWENYDPDEVVCNGYGVISTEAFPMRAICFLCGSAGKEALVHCCVCCEPYHPYCLEQGPPKFHQPGEKFSWICPKCTKCSACGEADKQKIHCQKCHKAYHPQCFNHKWRTDDRPTVCSNCLRCKSCGTDNITKFVGNLALCLACFKLRNKGNYCPLCQCCYDDNDFDTKMMECGKCNKWVHAKCEGLSDEQYQILSILPESVEFICCLCTTEATPFWRKAVQQELRSCLNNILRLMSKNRVAREAFKLTPLKACSPHVYHGALQSARRLQFVDSANPNQPEGSSSDGDIVDSEMEQVNATFKNKIDFGDSFNMSCSFLNDSKIPISPRMVEIKNKLNCNEYFSLHEFNESMESALQSASDGKLLEIYHSILKKVLPWFDPSVREEPNKTLDASRLEIDGVEGVNKKLFEELDSIGYQFQSIESVDTRACNLCKGIGDGLPEEEARLLYAGQNEWVHANCALWSSEVYEEIDGSLQNVQSAMTRGRSIKCAQCKQKGASVGCCLKGCHETYHFPCAQKATCHFNADRTMYCHLHDAPKDMNLITNPHDFAIRRSVYIEVDTKKKKLADRERVHYMVGSLSVVALGKVIPSISDSVEAITPVGFVCSRLFWSTHEPWKLVPYKITTSAYNSSMENYVDRNFTVDHSLAKHIVERKLKEICVWQKDDKERSDIYEFEDYEEPQNAGDILSPELTDAILEELPHDLLDGLSMQEMLKEYEELMNLEFKTTEINSNDNLSLNMNEKEDAVESKEAKELTVRELKRSKSEVFQKIKDQNRSCSLAYLHLDNTLSPAIKKRKITTPSFMQIVQVDGACDSGSECASPTHEGEDPWAEDGNVKCEKCHSTYRTKLSYERHLEHCDSLFTSESETEEANGVAPEEQSQIIYESFSFQATAQNQIKSTATLMNTQTIMEAKTQTQTVQDAGVIYNYQSHQTMKPNLVASNQQAVIDSAMLNQYCLSTQQGSFSGPTTTAQCIIPVETIAHGHGHGQVLSQLSQPMNEPMIQSIQTVPYSTAQDINFLNLAQPNHHQTAITNTLEPMHQLLVRPQSALPIQQKRCLPKPRAVFTKRPIVTHQPQQRMVQVMPQFQQNPSMILQQIPSSVNMLPSFVDQGGVQYVVTPQVNQPQPTTQLVQLPDNNFLSLVQNVQPMQQTMIIPQRMETGQLVIDGSGMVSWAPPIQPVYYGIETVQTTVMQSQHILPTTMPGMMTTNSSYSATTQVFQTSKLEPCLDGSYVIVNQVNQNQLQQVQQVPQVAPQIQLQTSVANMQLPTLQIKPAPAPVQTIPTSVTIQPQLPPPPLPLQAQISVPVAAQPIMAKTHTVTAHVPSEPTLSTWNSSTTVPIKVEVSQGLMQPEMKTVQVVTAPVVSTSSIVLLKKKPAQITSAVNPAVVHLINANTTNSTCNTNSITLPVAPFVSEQGIPTNIVTPTPKLVVPVQPARPMSRVLPMQTSTTQKKADKPIVEPMLEKTDKKVTVLGDVVIPKTCSPLVSPTISSKISITPQVMTYKVEVKEMNVDIKLRAKEIKSRDMPLLSKVHKLDTTMIHIDVKPAPTEKEMPLIPVVIDVKPELKKSPEKTPQIQPILTKKLEDKIDKDVLKVNKVSVAPLKSTKPKIALTTVQHMTSNKENIICDGNVHEPKYSKRPNTTSIYFKIESTDGFEYTATSLPQIWRKVFADVQAARASHNLPPLPDIAVRAFNDLDIMGLKTKGLRFLVEQLPDAVKCKQYKPLYHKPKDPYQFEDDDDEDSARRCVAYDNKREKYDMFGWLSSKHRTLEMYDLDAVLKKNASSSLPMAMRFRALKVTSKFSVGVYRSDIHGRGLFSLRDIESGEMVIEYAGEVIRSLLTDKREKYYNTKGIGCYMFRIDDNLVVDATMKGNAARFINHSCDPNCYSKVVEILGNKHIIIFALRRIICGEELTYDYKFPFEEDKIPCSCGTRRCRKFLN